MGVIINNEIVKLGQNQKENFFRGAGGVDGNAPSPPLLQIPLEKTPRQTLDVAGSNSIDTQFPFLYIHLTPKRVLINLESVGLNPSGGMQA